MLVSLESPFYVYIYVYKYIYIYIYMYIYKSKHIRRRSAVATWSFMLVGDLQATGLHLVCLLLLLALLVMVLSSLHLHTTL